MKKSILLLASAFLLGSCSLYIPASQKNIAVRTSDSEAKVYVEDQYIGKGSNAIIGKTKKEGFKQVKIVTEEGVSYHVMEPSGRATGWWITMPLDAATFIFIYPPMVAFSPLPKFWKYAKEYEFEPTYVYPKKDENEKDIQYIATKMNIQDPDKDFQTFTVQYKKDDLMGEFAKAEDRQYQRELKAEERKARSKKGAVIDPDENKGIDFDDTYFSEEIYQTLKTAGYIDTTGNVLKNRTNILGLESTIVGGKLYNVTKKGSTNNLVVLSLDIDWKFKNSYGQTYDSIRVSTYSDDFAFPAYYYTSQIEQRDDNLRLLFQNAVNNSFLELCQTREFDKHIKKGKVEIKNDVTTITAPNASETVTSPKDALKAAVIIKLKESHGSGFAISTDGYILTNYHVIAGDYIGKYESFKVIMPNGVEMDARVVSTNLEQDVALLKVDAPFEKAFVLPSEKSFSVFDEVYTVGAPVSVQLGNSLASGVISNERHAEGIDFIQMNMAVSAGNSGGPLFAMGTGDLFGVVTSKIVGHTTEGISFAVPAHKIMEYLSIQVK